MYYQGHPQTMTHTRLIRNMIQRKHEIEADEKNMCTCS